jgi:predicted glycosyltransferase
MRIPAFVIRDYEYVDNRLSVLTSNYVLHPSVLDQKALRRNTMSRERLIPFDGLKEDLSFWEVDLASIAPYEFPALTDPSLVKVLVRPPAEESHYYRQESGLLTRELLAWLSEQQHAVCIFSPRYPSQSAQLEEVHWTQEPIVLHSGVPFIPLLKGVDLVISAGGTMLREAACVGTPAYSTFKGPIGGVDRYLQSLGRLELIESRADLGRIPLVKAERRQPLALNPTLPLQLAELMLSIADSRRRRSSPVTLLESGATKAAGAGLPRSPSEGRG